MLTRSQTARLGENFTPDGWVYTGIITDELGQSFFSYQTGNYRSGFKQMLLLECDLDKDNVDYMVKHSLTREKGFDYSDLS